MKRSLLVAGLVLTIATSVISGTMAAYNVTVDDLAVDSVVAKNFVLTADKSESAFVNEKIAPGESKEIPFTVSNFDGVNTTETGMDVVINVNVSNGDKTSITPLTYELFYADDLDTAVASSAAGQPFEYDGLIFDASGDAQDEEFILVVEWPYGAYNNGDFALQGDGFGNTVQITVSGFQSSPVD